MQQNLLIGHEAGEKDGMHHPVTMLNYRTGGTPWFIVVDPNGRLLFNDFRIDADRFIAYINDQLKG